MGSTAKNEIARKINYTQSNLSRVIATPWELDIEEGGVWDNLGNAESWQGHGSNENFHIESCDRNDIVYELFIENECPGHLVDYTNKEECDALGAIGCEHEGEVLVPDNAILRITSIGEPEEGHAQPVWTVYLEFEGFKEN